MLTLNEIFSKVKAHLLSMGEPARDPINGNCAYRTSDGRSCAVGCLIPKEVYRARLEVSPLSEVLCVIPGMYPEGFKNDERFGLMLELRSCHDSYSPCEWPAELARIAIKYGVTEC